MLCTSCSKPVSPVVAVDIDGTLADYHVALAKFAAEYLDSPTFLDGFPYQGDIPYADWFTAEGAEVWLTTTRPHDRFDRVDPDTREWCRRNGIKFDGLLYDGDKMERLADIVDPERVVAVVDDQVNVLNEARDLFPDSTLILAAGRHNAKAPWDGNRLSLGNALPVVLKRVYKWHNNTKELSR
jgi:hypothetical protein